MPTIKRSYRDVLHPALMLDSANTATALGDALMGADVAHRPDAARAPGAELLLLDCLDWAPNAACDLFTLTLCLTSSSRAPPCGCVASASSWSPSTTRPTPDRLTAEIETGRAVGQKVILLAAYRARPSAGAARRDQRARRGGLLMSPRRAMGPRRVQSTQHVVLGNAIRELRVRRDLSQETLGRRPTSTATTSARSSAARSTRPSRC